MEPCATLGRKVRGILPSWTVSHGFYPLSPSQSSSHMFSQMIDGSQASGVHQQVEAVSSHCSCRTAAHARDRLGRRIKKSCSARVPGFCSMPSCSSSIGSEDGERIAEDLRVSIRTAEELGTGSLRIQLQTEDEEGSHDVSEGNGGHGSSWDLVTEVDRVNIARGYAAVVRVCCAWVNERLATDQCLHGEVGSGQAADRHLCASPEKRERSEKERPIFGSGHRVCCRTPEEERAALLHGCGTLGSCEPSLVAVLHPSKIFAKYRGPWRCSCLTCCRPW